MTNFKAITSSCVCLFLLVSEVASVFRGNTPPAYTPTGYAPPGYPQQGHRNGQFGYPPSPYRGGMNPYLYDPDLLDTHQDLIADSLAHRFKMNSLRYAGFPSYPAQQIFGQPPQTAPIEVSNAISVNAGSTNAQSKADTNTKPQQQPAPTNGKATQKAPAPPMHPAFRGHKVIYLSRKKRFVPFLPIPFSPLAGFHPLLHLIRGATFARNIFANNMIRRNVMARNFYNNRFRGGFNRRGNFRGDNSGSGYRGDGPGFRGDVGPGFRGDVGPVDQSTIVTVNNDPMYNQQVDPAFNGPVGFRGDVGVPQLVDQSTVVTVNDPLFNGPIDPLYNGPVDPLYSPQAGFSADVGLAGSTAQAQSFGPPVVDQSTVLSLNNDPVYNTLDLGGPNALNTAAGNVGAVFDPSPVNNVLLNGPQQTVDQLGVTSFNPQLSFGPPGVGAGLTGLPQSVSSPYDLPALNNAIDLSGYNGLGFDPSLGPESILGFSDPSTAQTNPNQGQNPKI